MIQPILKPPKSKKKKLANGYKDKEKRTCHYCGTYEAERHEVYGGANRQISIENNFQVDLCQQCHYAIHNSTGPEWKEKREYWKKHFQRQYENKIIGLGMGKNQARDLWLAMIGRNYLGE